MHLAEQLFASDSYWSILGNAGAIAGLLVLLHVGMVRFSRSFRSLALVSPYMRRHGVDADRDSRHTVVRALRSRVNGDVQTASGVIAALVRRHTSDQLSPWSTEVSLLREWLERCGRPGAPSLAARLVAPDQAVLADQFAADLRSVLAEFEHVVPVSAAVAAGGSSLDGRVAASALSGAAVIADASGTRGGALDEVLVWHDDTYRDESQAWSSSSVFDPTAEALPIDDSYRLGDYNGRLLELMAASVAANPRDGATTFVLQTRETSYRATEPPSPVSCKRLQPVWDDPATPTFHTADGESTRSRNFTDAATERTCPLTSYVSLLTFAEPRDRAHVRGYPNDTIDHGVDVLVLCRRSAATRNGASTLSATGGGVVELSQDGIRLDTDNLGRPAIARAALRELGEELGIASSDLHAQPVAVWVATVVGREASRSAPKGQLVGSVLYLGSTPLGVRGLHLARHSASQSRGGFEVDNLEFIAMAPGPSGLRDFCAVVHSLASELDQHGLLSCYYAAVQVYGPDATQAFLTAFRDAPWWAHPWTGEDSDLRVCRDVRTMLPLDRPALEHIAPQWAQHWAKMSTPVA